MKIRIEMLLVVVFIIFYYGCGKQSIEQPSAEEEAIAVLDKLEYSFNTYDVEEVVNCFDPKTKQAYESIMKIGDIMVFKKDENGKNSKALLQLAVSLLSLTADQISENGLPPLDIIVNSTSQLNDERFHMNVTFCYDYPNTDNADALSVTKDIDIIKVDEEWCITLINDHNSNITST